MKPSNMEKGSSVSAGDLILVSSSNGTVPALAPAESLAPSGFDPDQARALFKSQVYPVGSYIESDGDPSTELGGSWEQVFGVFLFGRKIGREVSDASQLPAGSKTVTLVEANLPVHSHSVTMSHSHAGNDVSHTHDTTHTHYPTSSANHNHTISSHNHSWTHTHPGFHKHNIRNIYMNNYGLIMGTGEFLNRLMVIGWERKTGKWGTPAAGTSSGGLLGFTMAVEVNKVTTDKKTITTTAAYLQSGTPTSTAYYSGYSDASGTSGSASSTFSVSGVVGGSTGGGQPHENMPPYYATNIWKRVA